MHRQYDKRVEDNEDIEGMEDTPAEDIDWNWEGGMVDLDLVAQQGTHNFHMDMEIVNWDPLMYKN